jgi:SOS-response transcriptional repressor LexA
MSVIDISKVLNLLLFQTKISEAALGRKIGVPRATINRLVSGKTPDPRVSTLEAISAFFDVTIDQLLGKYPLDQTIKSEQRKVPVVEWQNILQFKDNLEDSLQKPSTSYIPIEAEDWSRGLIAIIQDGDSMWPQFQDKTILIVDLNSEAKNRDFVIAYNSNIAEILFRQLIQEGSYKFLRPINAIFPTVPLNSDDEVIGVVVQSRICLRR